MVMMIHIHTLYTHNHHHVNVRFSMFALDKWEFLRQIFLWLSAFPVTNTHQFASKAIFSLESTFFHEQMETKADRLDLILKDP